MINLDILGSVATRIHNELRLVFYAMIPVMFCLAWVAAWIKNPEGSPDYIQIVKRLAIACLLMVGFSEITDTILSLTNGLAQKIGGMDTFENYCQMLRERLSAYPLLSAETGIWIARGFMLATISAGLSVFLFLVKMLVVAIYHFAWMLLIILAPIILSFHVFNSQLTITLFKTLIEVASWKIVWATMSAMLTAVPFGNIDAADHSFVSVLLLSIIISAGLILTPFIVRSLVSGGFSAMSAAMAPIALALPGRSLSFSRFSQGVGRATQQRRSVPNTQIPLNGKFVKSIEKQRKDADAAQKKAIAAAARSARQNKSAKTGRVHSNTARVPNPPPPSPEDNNDKKS